MCIRRTHNESLEIARLLKVECVVAEADDMMAYSLYFSTVYSSYLPLICCIFLLLPLPHTPEHFVLMRNEYFWIKQISLAFISLRQKKKEVMYK